MRLPLKILIEMKLDKVKFRSKVTGNVALLFDKDANIWVDTVTNEKLLSYQVYKQVSLFAKIV